LREENAKVQSALKNAVEARMIKDGEVSILRKNMEKVGRYFLHPFQKILITS
jgi:hypothetical protein